MPGEEATIKVLIADDDPIVRAVLEGLVGRADDLVLVGSASEATSLAEEHQPHVLDWVMPDGGGPRAADDISSVSPETKIIALTASDSEHAAMDMLRAGAINVLVKDSSMSAIADAIRSASRDWVRGGLDLGGTKIQAVVLDEKNEVAGKSRRPTPGEGGPPAVVEALGEALGDALSDAGLKLGALTGVGLGSPGAVDAGEGTVADARNIPEWPPYPYPMAAELGKVVDAPVSLGNDVQVGVEAEYALGAAKDDHSLLGVFWGTGVGGGIILDGEPWLGRGAAGEIGHMVVERDGALCPCGRRGCMEAYAGRGAMEIEARRLVDLGRETVLFEIMEERGRTRLQSGIWYRALDRGDELAIELIERALAALGAGIASAVNLLDVETVVIGGGLGTRLGEPYVSRIEAAMLPHLFVSERPPAVRLAALGDLGGAIGAALMVGRRDVA